MRIRLLSVIALSVGAIGAPSSPLAGQSLTPYDVFAFNNLTLTNTEINGSAAVGGSASLSFFGVGRELPSGFSGFSLVVGGALAADDGSVSAGNTYVGGALSTTFVAFPTPPVGGTSPVDFATEQTRLTGISDAYAALPQTGTIDLIAGELNFIGTSNFNVFDVPISELQGGTAGYEFVTPVGATDIINVIGSSASSAFNNTAFYFDCTQVQTSSSCLTGTNDATPADAANTIWNFSDQTMVDIGGPVHGSILAPLATVDFGQGDVVGTVVADNIDAAAEFYNTREFAGPLQPTSTPEPASMALMGTGLAGVAIAWRRKRRV